MKDATVVSILIAVSSGFLSICIALVSFVVRGINNRVKTLEEHQVTETACKDRREALGREIQAVYSWMEKESQYSREDHKAINQALENLFIQTTELKTVIAKFTDQMSNKGCINCQKND